VLFCLATLYAREGLFPQARQALDTVLTLEPGRAEARQLLAQVERASAPSCARSGAST
jgi:cytochrome c-type biogenesis protein CcmH/NrfG